MRVINGQVSGNDALDDCSVDVGQAEVSSGVSIGELFVVEAQEAKQGGVQVVRVDLLVDGLEAPGVGGAVDAAFFDSAAGDPHGEAGRGAVPPVHLAPVAA